MTPWGDFCGYAYSLEEAEEWEAKGEGWDTDPVTRHPRGRTST